MAIILAAYGGGGAATAANPNNGDWRAGESDDSGQVLQDDAEKTEDRARGWAAGLSHSMKSLVPASE